jgi:hypothetical protein
MMVYSCNPSTQEAETIGSQVPGQLGLHRKIPVSKKKEENIFKWWIMLHTF